MIGVFRERFFTFRMKLKMFITSSDHYLKYLALQFLVKTSGSGDFVSQNPLFSYGVLCFIEKITSVTESFYAKNVEKRYYFTAFFSMKKRLNTV